MNDERRQVRHTRTTQADVCILVAKPHPAPEVCSEVGVDVGVEGGRKCPSVQIELCCDFPPANHLLLLLAPSRTPHTRTITAR